MYCTGSTLPTRSCTTTNSRSVDDVVAGRPRREREERRSHVDAVRAEQVDGARRVGRGVTFVEPSERLVVQRLERRHHEQAPRVAQLGQEVLVREHVLDLDRAVEGEVREPLVQRAHDAHRVLRRVEEVGVAEGEVLGAGGDELRRCRRGPRPRRRPGRGRRRRPAPGSVGSGARTLGSLPPSRRGAARRRPPAARTGRVGGAGRGPGARRRAARAGPSPSCTTGRRRASLRPRRPARLRTRRRSPRRRRRRTSRRRARSSRRAS